jgi:uncharacterized cupredoxin-like copper-binding protein
MRLRHLSLFPALILIVAACSGAGATASPSAPAASASAAPQRIEVTLSDSFTIELASSTVPAGVPVTFVVMNAGAIDHEFYVGDEAAQAEHEEEMMAGGMRHDEPDGISVKPGETKELIHTFEAPGEMLAGCHEPGHYTAGMKAAITVTG